MACFVWNAFVNVGQRYCIRSSRAVIVQHFPYVQLAFQISFDITYVLYPQACSITMVHGHEGNTPFAVPAPTLTKPTPSPSLLFLAKSVQGTPPLRKHCISLSLPVINIASIASPIFPPRNQYGIPRFRAAARMFCAVSWRSQCDSSRISATIML